MNKVICDVCGTDYPETSSQCPICGCARGEEGQTSAGNSSQEETRSYTYVKGGRFSKSNVRKRLKAQARQAAEREEEARRKIVREDPRDLDRTDDIDDEDDEDLDDDDDMEGVSNKGLILIVILLLLAIIAVSSYIVVTFFGGDDRPQNTRPSQQTTQGTLPEQTGPTETEPEVLGTPCTKLVLNDLSIELVKYMAPWELDFDVEPADTTDTVIFTSSDTAIATVDDNGVVMGVGNGEATITISCGEFQAECKVVCQLQDLPSDPTVDTTEDPTEPSVTEPVDPELKLELKDDDVTLFQKGESWQAHKGEVPRDQIQWSSDDETVVTVTDGKVVAVGPGSTTIRAKYGDQEVTCVVRCKFPAETEPTEPADPDPTEPEETEPTQTEPTETQPAVPSDLKLLVNGAVPKYSYNDKPNSADVSLVVGDGWRCVLSVEGADDVKWTSGDSAVATVDADGRIVAQGEGKTTLKATVDGVEFIVMVRVKEA